MPKPMKATTVKIPSTLLRRAKQKARANGRSFSDHIRRLLKRDLEEKHEAAA